MVAFEEHDHFIFNPVDYTTRNIFKEHVRKTYDQVRELADYIEQYEGTIDSEFTAIVDHVNEQVTQLTDLYNDLLDNNVLDSEIQEKLTQLEQNYTPKLNDVTAQLAQTEINKADKTHVWNMPNMGQDVKEAMTGGSVAVVGVSAVDTENLKDESVVGQKISDKYSVMNNNSIHELATKQAKETLNRNSNLNNGTSNFYMTAGSSFSYIANDKIDNGIDLPINYYIRWSFLDSAQHLGRQYFTPRTTNNIKWGMWLRKSDINNLSLRKLYVELYYKNGGDPQKLRVTEALDREQLTRLGAVYNYVGVDVETDTYILSETKDWIYVMTDLVSAGFTFEEYNPRIVINETTGTGKIDIANFTVIESDFLILPEYVYPENQEEIDERLTDNLSREITEKDTTFFDETSDGFKLKNEYLQAVEITEKYAELVGLKGNFIGDSIVASANGYIEYLEPLTGMSIDKHALAGRGMADSVQGEGGGNFGLVFNGSNIDYTLYKLSLIAMGTNDFKLNVPLGSLNTDTNYNFDGGTNILNTVDVTPNSRLNGEESYPTPTIAPTYQNTTSNVLVEVIPGEHLLLNKDGGTTDLYWRVAELNNNVQVSRFTTSLDTYGYKVPEGVNQLWVSYPTGSNPKIIRNSDSVNFYGAYQKLISSILKENPEINIMLFTPLQRDNDNYDIFTTNSSGHKLEDYVNAVIEIGAFYGLPVYDAYRNSGVNMHTLGTFLYDGLHPNATGYKFITQKQAKFISNNISII